MYNSFHCFYNEETGEIMIRLIRTTNFDKCIEGIEKHYAKQGFVRVHSKADFFNEMTIDDYDNFLKQSTVLPF